MKLSLIKASQVYDIVAQIPEGKVTTSHNLWWYC